MLVSQSHILLPAAFFILLAISMISSLTLLFPKIPLKFIQIHISIMVLPPIVSLAGLVLNNGSMILGPWRLDSLSWLLATFVMTINFIVQRYSVRYLLGDHSYRKYFSLLTMSTAADSLAWLSDDLHLLMLFWGVTLLGLTILI